MAQQKTGNAFQDHADTMYNEGISNVVKAAVRDYAKEMEAQAEKERNVETRDQDLLAELDDSDGGDPELERLQVQRLMEMRREAESRQRRLQTGHGEYRTVREEEFLKEVTGSKYVVVNFVHDNFVRCKIVDKHLQELAPKYLDTKFFNVDAMECAFFVTKLNVQVLPCCVLFVDGIAVDRIVGFDELGGIDTFKLPVLVKRLNAKQTILHKSKEQLRDAVDDEDDYGPARRSIYGFTKYTSEDEDSDFD